MSTAELTSMLEELPEEDYNMIVMLINRLSIKNKEFVTLSEDQIVEELEESIRRSDNGNTISARAFSAEMRKKYAI